MTRNGAELLPDFNQCHPTFGGTLENNKKLTLNLGVSGSHSGVKRSLEEEELDRHDVIILR